MAFVDRFFVRTDPRIAAALEKRRTFLQRRGRKFKLRLPTQLFPSRAEREYRRDLRKIVKNLFDTIDAELSARLPELLRDAALEQGIQRLDDVNDKFQRIINGVLIVFGRNISENDIKSMTKRHARTAADQNRQQNDKVIRASLGVDVFRNEPFLESQLETFANENVRLIKNLSENTVTRIESIVTQGFRQGSTAKELSDKIRKQRGISQRRADLIARDQVGKLNGQLTKVRQQALGVTSYIWRTARDERVRHSHRRREGVMYQWESGKGPGNPPPSDGHPGEPINCRCYAEPVLEDLIDDDGQAL